MKCLPWFAIAWLASAQPAEPTPTLPVGWLGDWRGTLVISPPGATEQRVPMELKIAPLDRPGAWSWTLVYGEGPSRQERRYELLAGKEVGAFVVDEKNGLKLPARMCGSTLVSVFEVGGQTLVSRQEVRGETLLFEIIACQRTAAEEQKTLGQPAQPVRVFPKVAYQRAELRRKQGG